MRTSSLCKKNYPTIEVYLAPEPRVLGRQPSSAFQKRTARTGLFLRSCCRVRPTCSGLCEKLTWRRPAWQSIPLSANFRLISRVDVRLRRGRLRMDARHRVAEGSQKRVVSIEQHSKSGCRGAIWCDRQTEAFFNQ